MSNTTVLEKPSRGGGAKKLYIDSFGNTSRTQQLRKESYFPGVFQHIEISEKESYFTWGNRKGIDFQEGASARYFSLSLRDFPKSKKVSFHLLVPKSGMVHIVHRDQQEVRISFISRAIQLEKRGQIDSALDLIYDQIDSLLRSGKMETVNLIFKTIAPSNLSLDVILGLLTATLPARTKLALRKTFYFEAEKTLKLRGEWEDGLLAGLES